MSRDGSGVYSLPAGNPVVDGTTIEPTWANTTLADIVVQLNNVITGDGVLGPAAPIKFQSGSVGSPGITFTGFTTTGIYRDTNFVGFTFAGVKRLVATAAGAEVVGALDVSGGATLGSPLPVASGGTANATAAGARVSLGVNVVNALSKSVDYTFGSEDFYVYHPSTDANARVFTIDGSLGYAIGTVLTVTNMTANVVTISLSTDTMYLAGSGLTGNRSLAQYGVASIMKVESGKWIISGAGLS